MTPTNKQWEKEFDKEFPHNKWFDPVGIFPEIGTEKMAQQVKSFIRSLLHSQAEEVIEKERDRIAETLKKLLKPKEFTLNIHKILEVIYPTLTKTK